MNQVVLSGRLSRDPETRYSSGENATAISRYSLAVNRPGKDKGADFVSCVAFGKAGEFVEKYLKKGTKVIVHGHIQTGSYEKDGHKVFTTEVVVTDHEFCESKREENKGNAVPDTFEDVPITEELPFT